MRVKTSITPSKNLFQVVDKCSATCKSRSEFIETALWAFIKQMKRERQNRRDLEILNQGAEHLNQEADDVLSCQVPL